MSKVITFERPSIACNTEHQVVVDPSVVDKYTASTNVLGELKLDPAKQVRPRRTFKGTAYLDLTSNTTLIVHTPTGYWGVVPTDHAEPVEPKPERPIDMQGRILPGQEYKFPVYLLHISGNVRVQYKRLQNMEDYIAQGHVFSDADSAHRIANRRKVALEEAAKKYL